MGEYNHAFLLFKTHHCFLGIKSWIFSPGWCGSVDGSPVRFPVRVHSWNAGQIPSRGVQNATTCWFFSPSLSPFLPLSLKKKKKIPGFLALHWNSPWSACANFAVSYVATPSLTFHSASLKPESTPCPSHPKQLTQFVQHRGGSWDMKFLVLNLGKSGENQDSPNIF